MDVYNFGDFVKDLNAEGFDARSDIFNGQVGVIVGPKGLDPKRLPPDEIGIFFPLWELNDPTNFGFVTNRQFHDIVDQRKPGWTPFLNRQ